MDLTAEQNTNFIIKETHESPLNPKLKADLIPTLKFILDFDSEIKVTFCWQQTSYRKNLSLQIKPDKKSDKLLLFVKSNKSVSHSMVIDFLLEKRTWIQKSLLKLKSYLQQNQGPQLNNGELFPYLGSPRQLRFVMTPNKKVFFSIHNNHLNIHIPEKQWNQIQEQDLKSFWPELQIFYKRESQQFISSRIQIWCQIMNLHPHKIRFKNQSTRWGSCSSKGIINLNWRLIAAPLDVIDYILIHELAHLKHLNHSAQFWNLVDQFCPHVQSSEKWLKQHGASLDFLKNGIGNE